MNSPTPGRVHYAYTTALTSGASATGARVTPPGIKMARIVSSVDCWYHHSANPPAAIVGAGTFLPAGYVEIVELSAGDVFTAITDTAATGRLNVVELTR